MLSVLIFRSAAFHGSKRGLGAVCTALNREVRPDNLHTTRKILSSHGDPFIRREAENTPWNRRVQSERFVDHGVQERQMLKIHYVDVAGIRHAVLFELGSQLLHKGGVPCEVVEGVNQRRRRRVATRNNEKPCIAVEQQLVSELVVEERPGFEDVGQHIRLGWLSLFAFFYALATVLYYLHERIQLLRHQSGGLEQPWQSPQATGDFVRLVYHVNVKVGLSAFESFEGASKGQVAFVRNKSVIDLLQHDNRHVPITSNAK